MPRTRSLAWSELKIGVLTIAALAIASLTVFMLTGDRGFFWQQYALKARFENVAGLKPGSPVRLAGVEIGTVSRVELTGAQVDVIFQVNRTYLGQITTNSTARLGSVSLLGEAAVDITPATTGTPIPEWGYVPEGTTVVQLADVTDSAARGLQELTTLLVDIRAGRGTVGRLVTGDELYSELRRFAAAASDLTEGLQQGRGSLGRLLNDPATAEALDASLNNIQSITRRIGAGEGSLGKLVSDATFARTLTATTSNLETLTTRLNEGQGTLGKLMTDDAVFDQLNSVTRQLGQLMTQLNDGEGTAGQLLKDRQLYENMNQAVIEMRALLADIRQDPRKFLTVRVSIF